MPQIAIAAYGIYQGVQAGKKADQAQRDRNDQVNAQIALGKEDRDYYRQKFGPMNQMLVDYAMGNKPSPYLAKAKGQVQQGYQAGMRQLNDISGRAGLGQSGIGEGQKIGLGMEAAKANAGLDLQDQAQRYGVAQNLSQMENNSLQGSRTMSQGYGMGAGYANQDMKIGLDQQSAAFSSAAKGLGASYEDYMDQQHDKEQSDKIEAGGDISPAVSPNLSSGMNYYRMSEADIAQSVGIFV